MQERKSIYDDIESLKKFWIDILCKNVKIQLDNSLLGVVIDRFGKNTKIHKADEYNFVAYLTVEISPPFLGWIFQFGGKVKIISPENVKSRFVEYMDEVKKSY